MKSVYIVVLYLSLMLLLKLALLKNLLSYYGTLKVASAPQGMNLLRSHQEKEAARVEPASLRSERRHVNCSATV